MVNGNDREQVFGRMTTERIIAVIRENDPSVVPEIVRTLAGAGIGIIEITLTTPDAVALIAACGAIEGVVVGGGSVLAVEEVERIAEAGGRFIASPVGDPAVIAAARAAGLVAMPGALTPTEIVRARRDGADIVKLFPMPADPVAYLRAVRAPLPHVPLAPSGGVDDVTAPLLLRAGATALNLGSWLTPEAASLSERLEMIGERAGGLKKGVGNRE